MNLIPEAHKTGSHPSVLVPWPGSIPFSSVSSGLDRGAYEFGEHVYKISGTTLYKISDNGSTESIGEILGSNRCIFDDDGTNLIIATGQNWYQYDGTNLTNFSSSSPELYPPGNSVAFLGGFAIYDTIGGIFLVSDFGDPDSVQDNNFGTAESSPDNLKRVFVFNERAYLFGDKTIETWVLGVGNPPLRKTQNGTMKVGLKDTHSVAASRDYVYFRGDDGMVYRFSSTAPTNVTSSFAASAFESYAGDTSVSYIINIQGGTYYVINFTGNNKTWCFSEKNHASSPGIEDWFQLSTGVDQDRYIGDFYVKAFNRHLICNKNNGDLLSLNLDTFTDNGDVSVRARETAPVHGGLAGQEGARMEMSWFEVILKKGVGASSGYGVNPKIYISASFDGADSYSNDEEIDIGRTGQSMIKARWYKSASFYEAVFRITVYEPIFISIHSAAIGIKLTGE